MVIGKWQYPCLQEALDLFGEVLTADVVNPANSKLFTICKEAKLLSKKKALNSSTTFIDHE